MPQPAVGAPSNLWLSAINGALRLSPGLDLHQQGWSLDRSSGSLSPYQALKFKVHYKTTGVERTASGDYIKNAFRRLAREHHPDSNRSSDE